jgi:Na+-transporting methylmalonyl-CoA/oxaloacetate decarboxylase gamma subunit
MRILRPGVIKQPLPDDGFVMLRGLTVFFIVLFCFSLMLAGMAAFSHRSAEFLIQVQREIAARNEQVMSRLR